MHDEAHLFNLLRYGSDCCYILQTHLRASSQAVERWLCSWIALIVLWSALYLLYWLDNTAGLYDIIEFIIPLILLPLVCSAFAEVSNEGKRVQRVSILFTAVYVMLTLTILILLYVNIGKV